MNKHSQKANTVIMFFHLLLQHVIEFSGSCGGSGPRKKERPTHVCFNVVIETISKSSRISLKLRVPVRIGPRCFFSTPQQMFS